MENGKNCVLGHKGKALEHPSFPALDFRSFSPFMSGYRKCLRIVPSLFARNIYL